MTGTRRPSRDIRADEYIHSAFEPSDHLAILVRNRHRGETIQRIATAARIEEPSFQSWLEGKNRREQSDVYVGMNPLKPGARSRTKDDILAIRHLYVDLDHEGPSALAAIGKSTLVPPPNYVLTTSPGKFQVIWRVAEIPQDQAEALLRAMARKFGADPAATDSTRVLRFPGFLNRKYEKEILVKAEAHSDRVNHLLDFKLKMELDSPYQPARRTLGKTASGDLRALSQSELDWAFAKRALARGENPEDLMHRIAQFREGEKHDPFDYARRTVTKAQYAVQAERDDPGAGHASEQDSTRGPDQSVTES